MRKTFLKFLLVPVAAASLAGCGINSVPTAEENAKAKWADVQAAFQERANLIPNLANIVKGAAAQENKTLTEVIQARAQATSPNIQVNPNDLSDPAKMAAFQAAQNQLSGSLSRLLVVAENYPTLLANQGFMALQAQLEGTENRIAVARNRYIKAVQDYNVTVHSFPSTLTAWALGYKEKPNFSVENEQAIARPPTVDFGTAPAKPSATVPGDAK